jgi:FkbM family methyltransferase
MGWHLATEADVLAAYRLILQREPDEAGLAHYRQRVREGLPLAELVNNFLMSDEYHDRLEHRRAEDLREVDLGDYRLLVSIGDPEFGALLHSYGVYEEPVRDAMRANLEPGDACIDVGANIGVLTLLASKAVGPSGKVLAIEPNPDNVQMLYRNIAFAQATNVDVLPLAASDRRSVFSLTGRSNTHLVSARGAAEGGGSFVQSIVLDELLGHVPRLDFVKMDIEGHEPAALRGMRRLLERHRPVLLVEFNPRCLGVQSEDPRGYLDFVFSLYPQVQVVSQFSKAPAFTRARDLMSHWTEISAQVTAKGLMPEGLLHFDLLARARP